MSKGKSKKKTKISKIILTIISSLFLLLILTFIISESFRYTILMSYFNVITPKPAIFSELQTIVKDYNRDCEKGYEVKIIYTKKIGPQFYVEISFKKNKIDDNNKRILFLQYLHNNFGYSELSCSDENTEYFNREYQTINITFNNIILEYGNELALPVSISSLRKNIDVLIQSTVIFDFSILEEFNGNILLILSGHEDIKDELKQKYNFMIY